MRPTKFDSEEMIDLDQSLEGHEIDDVTEQDLAVARAKRFRPAPARIARSIWRLFYQQEG